MNPWRWYPAGLLLLSSALAAPPPKPPIQPPAKPTSFELQQQSLQKQRESLKAQLGADIQAIDVDFGFLKPMTPLPPVAQPDCPALPSEQSEALISAASRKQSVSANLLRAVMRQESAFKPCAISIRGAQGLMQIMPDTAAQLSLADPFDPEQNVQAGATFLKQLLKKYNGDVKLALIGYNAGSGVADARAETVLPQETQNYLTSILADLGSKEISAIEAAEKAPPAKQP